MEHARTMRALAGPPSGDRSSRLDWGRIEAWAQQVARGDLGEVNAVCEANGALAPRVLWQPTSSQIQTPQLRFLWDYWGKLKGDARLPASRSVDLSALESVSGYEAFLDVVDDGRDFRIRRCSAVILALAGYDVTGQLISEYAVSSPIVCIVESAIAIHRAAYRRGEPLYVDGAPTRAAHDRHSLLLPLADDDGTVGGILHGAVPIGAGGLPIGMMRF
jgi:hypothetical protein